MSVQDQIQQDIKTAMKARDKDRLGVLRMLSSALKTAQIDSGEPLSEGNEQAILKRQLKQREESEEAFRKAGREEQANSEAAEAKIVREYLPEPLSEERLNELIEQAISDTGASGMKDMGEVMGKAMEMSGGQADGKQLAALVRGKLQ